MSQAHSFHFIALPHNTGAPLSFSSFFFLLSEPALVVPFDPFTTPSTYILLLAAQAYALFYNDFYTIHNLVIMKYIAALPLAATMAAAQMQVMSLASAAATGAMTHTVRLSPS
jgi:hypothetical protein